MKISVSIAHAPHKPGRKEALERLLSQLGSCDSYSVWIEESPGKPHEWSERQWLRSLRDKEATHCLMLNDDVISCESFMKRLYGVLAARPNHIVSLYNQQPLAKEADAKGLRWITSRDGLIGNAYVLPAHVLRHFLEWRSSALVPGTIETLSEDQLINLYAMAHGFDIWHTVPALISHDETVPTCYGNAPVKCAVPPRDPMPTDWDTDGLDAGRWFRGNHHALVQRLKVPLYERYWEAARL